MAEPVDPRAAALAQAQRDRGTAIAMALVYVGDQIGRLVPESDARGALIDSGYVPLETRLLDAAEGHARFAIGPRVFEVLTGQQFELFIDAAGGVNAREPGQEEPSLTFGEMRPVIRSQATALLWEKRALMPEHTDEWVDDVLSIAEGIIENNGGVYVRAGD